MSAVLITGPSEFPASRDAGGGSKLSKMGVVTEVSSGSTTAAKIKASGVWQNGLWERWPNAEGWPAVLDIYEAAAYLRVSPDTIRRAVIVARDGKARLAHQRLGSIYRIRKKDLDAFGVIPGRQV